MTRIRLATVADAAGVQAIYAPVVRDTAISFEYEPPTVEEMARRIESTLRQYPYLVLEADGDVLGYAYGGAFRTRAAYAWSVETSVYLREDARGRGIGQALYAALIPLLQQAGYCQVYAGITLPNAASVALHERAGFAHLGTYERAGYKFGDWHSVGWWQLLLPLPSGDPALAQPIAEVINTKAARNALSDALAHVRA